MASCHCRVSFPGTDCHKAISASCKRHSSSTQSHVLLECWGRSQSLPLLEQQEDAEDGDRKDRRGWGTGQQRDRGWADQIHEAGGFGSNICYQILTPPFLDAIPQCVSVWISTNCLARGGPIRPLHTFRVVFRGLPQGKGMTLPLDRGDFHKCPPQDAAVTILKQLHW